MNSFFRFKKTENVKNYFIDCFFDRLSSNDFLQGIDFLQFKLISIAPFFDFYLNSMFPLSHLFLSEWYLISVHLLLFTFFFFSFSYISHFFHFYFRFANIFHSCNFSILLKLIDIDYWVSVLRDFIDYVNFIDLL